MRHLLRLVIPSLILLACSTAEKYQRQPLAKEILRPRPGMAFSLTNNACEEWDQNNVCTKWDVARHDLADPMERDALNKLDFVCKVGGHRWKICPDKAALCRTTYHHCGFLGMQTCKAVQVEENYEFLISADTKCFSMQAYGYDSIN
jgi:hypothetical protein